MKFQQVQLAVPYLHQDVRTVSDNTVDSEIDETCQVFTFVGSPDMHR
ncbi:MAG: hypothetical protein GFH27_549349n109 [Chloroflexi bacterium AL-W]|nr:hypothetical protein [Chloroflexi bacterium AL-N1]NOK70007.1 hypothetical protein [Chloroflexi bacterium AL-N10]NOK73695.1 hypothetical protein [Chloroflexi bacterium AL-N5]NOK85539.1 hypothetical protein [Chloroflexi bacterium AL-W]NOK91740.1 hypothetical protein [Chloroflexi bacterium AL-N15]